MSSYEIVNVLIEDAGNGKQVIEVRFDLDCGEHSHQHYVLVSVSDPAPELEAMLDYYEEQDLELHEAE